MAGKRSRMKPSRRSVVPEGENLAFLTKSPLSIPSLSSPSALRRLRKRLLAGGPAAELLAGDVVQKGFLCLIPSILSQSNNKVVALCVEILGALSMSSFATHRIVVSNKEAMRALIEVYASQDLDLLLAANHAVNDILITPFGREALRECSVLDRLLHLVCWIADLSREIELDPANNGHPSAKQELAICKEVNDLLTTVLTALDVLLRDPWTATISEELRGNVIDIMRKQWQDLLMNDQLLLRSGTVAENQSSRACDSPIRQLVAKCLVQLAMEHGSIHARDLSSQKGLFETTSMDLKHFYEKYWEREPVLLCGEMPSCFSHISKKISTFDAVVKDFFSWCVACPPAAADQVDSLHLFETIESHLGEALVYGQDVRIVKTAFTEPLGMEGSAGEMHYNQNGVIPEGQGTRHHVHPSEISRAVKEGYTVAMKGMELRHPDIAKTAICLAGQCGQPSVGANCYLTPSESQGLGVHFDDHCVFVCQLVGRKTWTVYTPQQLLPRLYSRRQLDHAMLRLSSSTTFDLDEGDVLYIPRGFPHKARCGNKENSYGSASSSDSQNSQTHAAIPQPVPLVQQRLTDNCNSEDVISTTEGSYSLHLTFGVEVEPPFEWEGLVHIALRLWVHDRWQARAKVVPASDDSNSNGKSSYRLERFCEWLLHVAINILGEKEISLRKACLIPATRTETSASCPSLNSSEAVAEQDPCSDGTTPSGGSTNHSSACPNAFDPLSMENFHSLLELVAENANHLEVDRFLRGAGESCFSCDSCSDSRMEWLRLVPLSAPEPLWSTPITSLLSEAEVHEMKDGFDSSEIKASFARMKAEFSEPSVLLYHRTIHAFTSIWSQYRTVRTKFMNGMLALHAGWQ